MNTVNRVFRPHVVVVAGCCWCCFLSHSYKVVTVMYRKEPHITVPAVPAILSLHFTVNVIYTIQVIIVIVVDDYYYY